MKIETKEARQILDDQEVRYHSAGMQIKAATNEEDLARIATMLQLEILNSLEKQRALLTEMYLIDECSHAEEPDEPRDRKPPNKPPFERED